ncbi:CbaC protein [Halovivax cerinus]|uniref:CbaC protein n=1 Tax=Halovivax cerinus TaxID=1487865 RepID=A0ABD5NRY1_9EURY|nr:CbaC protein [Halovivax cerinus]
MRTTPAKLLIVSALLLVFLVEGRTVLGFFDVYVSPLETVIVGLLVFAVLLGWAVAPRRGE